MEPREGRREHKEACVCVSPDSTHVSFPYCCPSTVVSLSSEHSFLLGPVVPPSDSLNVVLLVNDTPTILKYMQRRVPFLRLLKLLGSDSCRHTFYQMFKILDLLKAFIVLVFS